MFVAVAAEPIIAAAAAVVAVGFAATDSEIAETAAALSAAETYRSRW